ncbi:TonB-dependent receptor [Bacteroides pyogenes JCM 6292]|uniref:TonB-dependent receptor n=1 Tax=Bacteroides pyogenes JCM 6292 TaxID=1235809 RepID=W4PBF6_9BACE|nr:TonB-dependent receptor [Bacteroides pyogenes JCM 6292]
MNNSYSNIDYGVGVRVLSGDQSGYAYVENSTLEEMLKAARTAARIASANKGNKPLNLTEKVLKKNYYTVSSPWEEVNLKDKMPYLQRLNERIFAMDKRVRKVQARQSDTTSHIFFCNSEGVMYYDYRPMVTLGAVCIMEENGKMENGYAARAYRKGYDFLTDDVVEVIAREAWSKRRLCSKQLSLKAARCRW